MGPITAKSITGYVKPTFRTRLGFRTPSGVGKSSMPEPRGSPTESYGESGFERGLGLTDAAQNRTHLRSDLLNLDRKSGRRKADGPILRFRRLLLGSAGASGSTSRRGCALEEEGVGPCRVTAPVSRIRVRDGVAPGAEIGPRKP